MELLMLMLSAIIILGCWLAVRWIEGKQHEEEFKEAKKRASFLLRNNPDRQGAEL